jgi:hypothetical protein
MSKPRLAIVVRGIGYYRDDTKVSRSSVVDYRNCLASFKENLLKPLRTRFEIDVFLITYYSELLPEMIKDFSPKDVFIMPRKDLKRQSNPNEYVCKLICDCFDLVEEYKYDFVLENRFDLYYYRPINPSRIDLSKVNFAWCGELGQCDDSFIIFPIKFLPRAREFLENVYIRHRGYTHALNSAFPNQCHYISQNLDPDNGYHFPDFFVIYRFIKHENFESRELVMQEEPFSHRGGIKLY